MDGQEQLSAYKTMLENLTSQPENLSILEKLAGDGDADVAYILGWCYFKGEYLPKDFDKSMYWLEQAKTLGDDRAEELMVYCRFLQIAERSRNDRRS